MENLGNKKLDILEKINKLNNAKDILKQEFVGIDDIIDNLITYIEGWYLFSYLQRKPSVINLWGLTGVGKSSLVLRLLQLLELNHVKVDMGDDESSIKYDLSNMFTTTKYDKSSPDTDKILIFDEFQLCRTIDEEGTENNKSTYRFLWDLLDTGNIEIIGNGDYDLRRLVKYLLCLDVYISSGGELENGWVPKKHYDLYRSIMNPVYGDIEILDNKEYLSNYSLNTEFFFDPKLNIKTYDSRFFINDKKEMFCFSISFINQLYEIISNNNVGVTKTDIANKIMSFNNINQFSDYITSSLRKGNKPDIYDLSQSLIFIIGNLDEAYKIQSDMNPDNDADIYYDFTKKINIVNIKKSLLTRFRAEQISRLGNKHLIYPSISKKGYFDIIDNKLNILIDLYKEKYNLDILLDNSFKQLIYDEGVIPTQGVRPILSAINIFFESQIGTILANVLKKELNIDKLSFKYLPNLKSLFIDYYQQDVIIDTLTININNLLSITNVRDNKNKDMQPLIALHEAGHLVCSLIGNNLLPSIVRSLTANVDCEGFVQRQTLMTNSYDSMIKEVVILYGGLAAEKLYLDNDTTVGAASDIQEATGILINLYKFYGYKHPFRMAKNKYQENLPTVSLLNGEVDEKVIQLANLLFAEATDILKKNEKLYFTYVDTLIKKPFIEKDEILTIYKTVTGKDGLELKTPDNYYNYTNKITNLIEEKLK